MRKTQREFCFRKGGIKIKVDSKSQSNFLNLHLGFEESEGIIGFTYQCVILSFEQSYARRSERYLSVDGSRLSSFEMVLLIGPNSSETLT